MKAYCYFCKKTVEPNIIPTRVWGYKLFSHNKHRKHLFLCPICGGKAVPHAKQERNPTLGDIPGMVQGKGRHPVGYPQG